MGSLFRHKGVIVGIWLAAMLAFFLFFRRSATEPMPEEHAAAKSEPMRPTATGGNTIAGTISLAKALEGKAHLGDTLFVIARRGSAGGPPLAAKKLSVAAFPMTYTIGAEDVMMQGAPFEGEVQVSVRVDKDGNAMTKNPGDLVGQTTAPVAVGSQHADIVIDQAL